MKKNTETSLVELSFYKDGPLWYADIPQYINEGLGTRANLLMVDGADTFLEILSDHSGKVSIEVSDKPFNEHDTVLKKIQSGINKDLLHNIGHAPVEYGAYYNVIRYKGEEYNHRLWLCPVAEYVFEGIYPDTLYCRKAK